MNRATEGQKRTAAIIGIELPEEDVREVTPEDKEGLLERVQRAEEKLDDLIEELRLRRYKQAAGYIENAKKNLFTYVKFWLEYGMVSPRVSSMLERMMREIGRRLKKIAFGWSEFGAAKMTRIIIKRITSAHQWDEYWQRRLRLNGHVILIYRGVSAV